MIRLLLSIALALPLLSSLGCEKPFDVCIQYQADWCGPCHAQEPMFVSWADSVGVDFVIRDITHDARAKVSNGIVRYPTYVYYRNGVELYRVFDVHHLHKPPIE